MLRIDQNPPQIFVPGGFGGQDAAEPGIAELAASASTWFVLRAKSNQEKQLALYLMRRGIGFYIPMVKRRNKSRHTTLLPLLPRFVFAVLNPGHVLRSPHLFRAEVVHEEWRLLRDLTELKAEVDSGRVSSMADLSKGRRYRVTEGAFTGCEGELVEKDHRGRWGYLMSFLGPIRIGAEALELVA